MEYDDFLDLVLDNMKKIVSPEEWLEPDLQLSKPELFTLVHLEKHGEIIMSRLAEYIDIPMSTATGIVDRLVKSGHIERERNETDRRIVLIRLTGRGKALVGKLKDTIAGYVETILGILTEEEKIFLYGIFNRIIAAFSEKRSESPDARTGTDGAGSSLRKIRIE